MNRVPIELRYLVESRTAVTRKPVAPPTIAKEPRQRKPAVVKERLTAREREVFALYLEGHRAKEIALRLGGIAEKTVWAHQANIMRKLGAKNEVELVKIAIRDGYTSLEEMVAE